MLSLSDAARRLEQYKHDLGIPTQAVLSSLEKRYIELSDGNEIEPVTPMLPLGEDVDAAVVPTAVAPLAIGAKTSALPGYSERLAWVGMFDEGILFWELAIDANGDLIRLRKSR